MEIFINASDELPIYRQIMRQMMDAIAGGRLDGGEQLPSHRELSERLVVAPLTVKRAYDELEALGYVETRRGRGSFVAERLPRAARGVQQEQLATAARRLLAQAYLAGFQLADVLTLMTDADHALTNGPMTRPRTHRNKGRDIA